MFPYAGRRDQELKFRVQEVNRSVSNRGNRPPRPQFAPAMRSQPSPTDRRRSDEDVHSEYKQLGPKSRPRGSQNPIPQIAWLSGSSMPLPHRWLPFTIDRPGVIVKQFVDNLMRCTSRQNLHGPCRRICPLLSLFFRPSTLIPRPGIFYTKPLASSDEKLSLGDLITHDHGQKFARPPRIDSGAVC